MISYRCPNCGRVYNYGGDFYPNYQCMNCGRFLKKSEDVKQIKHPELNPMLNNKHVIGKVPTNQKNQPKCPTCGSTNIKKVSGVERGTSVAFFGLFSKKIGKQFKCNSCGYMW